jgi:hypothetical protein
MRTLLFALALVLLSAPALAVNKDDAEFAGACAWGLAKYGAVVPTDCSVNWTDPKTKKTYCFSSDNSKTSFLKDAETNVHKAEEKASEVHKM